MKPVAFDYIQAQSTEEALACLKDSDHNVRVLAGGQSLVAMLNLRLVRPNVLVDISQIESLSTIRKSEDMLEIGAAVTQAELKQWPGLVDSVPLLSMALPFVGHFQTRNKGTICGSLAHADPSSELPLCLATLNGSVVLQSARRQRVLNAAEFQTGMLSTACQPDEMIVAAHYPISREGDGFAFREVARMADFALLSFPYRWEGTNPAHHGLDRDIIDLWCCQVSPIAETLTGTPNRRRLMRLFDFRDVRLVRQFGRIDTAPA